MNDRFACVVIDRSFFNYKARGNINMEQVKMEQDTGESDKSSDEDTESSGSEEDSSGKTYLHIIYNSFLTKQRYLGKCTWRICLIYLL